MKRLFLSLAIAASTSLPILAQQTSPLKEWKAGTTVTMSEIERYGINSCFCSSDINDNIYKRIYGKSYKTYCTIPRSTLRYVRVLHYTLNGSIRMGEIVCHKDIAGDLVDIFRQLFNAHYPIESIRLIDDYEANDERAMNANNTSCFNFRYVAGSKVLSNHSYGKAIDLNPLYNPYVKKRANGTVVVSPKSGAAYADRTKNFNYKIDRGDLAYKLFTQHGFSWGGNWKSLKDYQHFEKK